VYDFALPPLVLHALYRRDATPLRRWLEIRPYNAITVLDTHDGIGVADVGADRDGRIPGLLPPDAIDALIETIHERSGDESRLASGTSARNVDTAQINCTFYDALGRRDTEYLVARAIQCFLPGIPQIYYVGLLAGTNDLDLLRRTGEGRDINRHHYTPGEVQSALAMPVVQALVALLRIRNTYAAFQGTFHVESPDAKRLVLAWNNAGAIARLDVDLAEMRAAVTCAVDKAGAPPVVWCSSLHKHEAMQGECR
jgi:sucrose phosphorylase